jgi:hypothetical protein
MEYLNGGRNPLEIRTIKTKAWNDNIVILIEKCGLTRATLL